MSPEGDIPEPQMSNEATDVLAPSDFVIFRAQLVRIFALFRQRTKKDPRRVRIRVVLPRLGVPGRGHCSLKFQHGF